MKSLKVFYSDKQNVTDNIDSGSPSAGKPAQVLASWQTLGIPLDIEDPKPCTREQMALAHSPEYVNGVLNLKIPNGFGNRLESVARSLPYTTGAMKDAALFAFRTGSPAAALVSGFHHAHYDSGGAFCTFEGLIIASQVLKLDGATSVGILDCDEHAGNGTKSIIERLSLDYISHWSLGYSNVDESNADEWLKNLPHLLQSEFPTIKVLLYQAGADCHIDDPLGGRFTNDQMRLRDRIVFEYCKEKGIGCAFDLAGGYQEPLRKVLDIHDGTLRECHRVFGRE